MLRPPHQKKVQGASRFLRPPTIATQRKAPAAKESTPTADQAQVRVKTNANNIAKSSSAPQVIVSQPEKATASVEPIKGRPHSFDSVDGRPFSFDGMSVASSEAVGLVDVALLKLEKLRDLATEATRVRSARGEGQLSSRLSTPYYEEPLSPVSTGNSVVPVLEDMHRLFADRADFASRLELELREMKLASLASKEEVRALREELQEQSAQYAMIQSGECEEARRLREEVATLQKELRTCEAVVSPATLSEHIAITTAADLEASLVKSTADAKQRAVRVKSPQRLLGYAQSGFGMDRPDAHEFVGKHGAAERSPVMVGRQASSPLATTLGWSTQSSAVLTRSPMGSPIVPDRLPSGGSLHVRMPSPQSSPKSIEHRQVPHSSLISTSLPQPFRSPLGSPVSGSRTPAGTSLDSVVRGSGPPPVVQRSFSANAGAAGLVGTGVAPLSARIANTSLRGRTNSSRDIPQYVNSVSPSFRPGSVRSMPTEERTLNASSVLPPSPSVSSVLPPSPSVVSLESGAAAKQAHAVEDAGVRPSRSRLPSNYIRFSSPSASRSHSPDTKLRWKLKWVLETS